MAKLEDHLHPATPIHPNDFRQFLEEQGLAASTIRAYLRDVAAFERWEASVKPKRRSRKPKTARTARRREEVPPTSDELIFGFLTSFKKPPSPPYRKRLRAALRHLFKYRNASGALRGDKQEQGLFLLWRVERAPIRAKATTLLSLTELQNLFQVTLETSRPTERVRNTAMIRFLYGTGLTVTELCALKLEDIHHQADEPQAMTIAARAEYKVLPLSGIAQRALSEWLCQRSQLHVAGDDLWITLSRNRHKNRADPLSPRGVQALLRHYGEKARLSLTPNVLRQSYKHELEQADVDKRVVGALLGYRTPGDTPSRTELQQAVALLPDPMAPAST